MPLVDVETKMIGIDRSKAICELLKENRIDYWIDEEGKYSGSNFKGVIVEQIKKAAIVLFLSSENSNKSDNVTKEIGIAVYYLKPIIPIKLDNAPYNINIKYDLCSIDYIEYKQDGCFSNKMLDSIRILLGINNNKFI